MSILCYRVRPIFHFFNYHFKSPFLLKDNFSFSTVLPYPILRT
nr:MAG TPA: hypothetical protein [Caudoviricetes sp.]